MLTVNKKFKQKFPSIDELGCGYCVNEKLNMIHIMYQAGAAITTTILLY